MSQHDLVIRSGSESDGTGRYASTAAIGTRGGVLA